ncbi:hypothetical protein [Micromonospora pallida]|nr:hypothetical protein [Micromonospora pallida]
MPHRSQSSVIAGSGVVPAGATLLLDHVPNVQVYVWYMPLATRELPVE